MAKNPIKKPLNDIIFFCGFDTETTQKLENKTIYTLVDLKTNTKIYLTLWQPEDFNEDEYVLSIEHHGLETLSETGERRWERVLTKLNNIPKLTISIENLNESVLNEEQNKELDKLCEEYDIDVESINSETLAE